MFDLATVLLSLYLGTRESSPEGVPEMDPCGQGVYEG
jgi:hypothetical protein